MNTTPSLARLLITFMYIGTSYAVNASPQVEVGRSYADLSTAQWLHGSESCETDNTAAIQVMQADRTSFVLRQNKCVTYEAPFIYVLIGRDRVLVIDTGANEAPEEAPIYDTVMAVIAQAGDNTTIAEKNILVIHSHSHGDHTKGDVQFIGKENTEVVGTKHEDMLKRLGFADWPNREASIDLGGRVVTLIPIPGHQDQGIAIYDEQTGWLLTGDTLYPGLIRVKDWDVFKSSVKRLLEFSNTHELSLILGGHIEMNAETGKIYPLGSRYQPLETPLALRRGHLQELHNRLQNTSSATKLIFKDFVVSPLSWMEKMLIKMMTPNNN